MKLAEISDEELRHHGLLESLEALKKCSSSTINSFHEIGWIDPLPKLTVQQMSKSKGSKKNKKKAEKLAAQNVKNQNADNKQMALDYLDAIDDPELMKPILSLALPSQILLFKMMRACIAVKRIEDLWMYVHQFSM